MDSYHFDALARQLYVLTNRRQGLRVLLASLAAGGFGLASVIGDEAPPAPAKPHKKKKRKRKKKGPPPRTCQSVGVECLFDSDCCVPLKCVNGSCEECSGLGEECAFDEDCCFEDHICANNDRGGGAACPGPVRWCCGDTGAPCVADCDCCGEVRCFNGLCGVL